MYLNIKYILLLLLIPYYIFPIQSKTSVTQKIKTLLMI